MQLKLILSSVLLLCLGTAVFTIANHVQIKERGISHLDAKIAREQENMRVLQAEWTFLTSPDRLEKIAVAHFQVAPIDGRQYAALDAVPLRAALDEIAPPVEEKTVQLAQNDVPVKQIVVAQAAPVNTPPVARAVESKPKVVAAALPAPMQLPTLAPLPVSQTTGGAAR